MKSFSTRLFTSTCDGGLNIVMPCTLMYKAVKSKSGSKAVQRSRKHTQRDKNSHCIGSLLYSFKELSTLSRPCAELWTVELARHHRATARHHLAPRVRDRPLETPRQQAPRRLASYPVGLTCGLAAPRRANSDWSATEPLGAP